MKLINQCPRCGGELKEINGKYECSFCGAIFEEEKINDIKTELDKAIDELKQEKVANLRNLLWEAVHEKYQSKEKIISISRDIRNYLPDDFLACFYETVNTKSVNEINEYLNDLDIKRYSEYIDLVIEYMLKVVEYGSLLQLNNLIENTYKNKDLELYDKYITELSNVSNELEDGIYDLDLTRDVFIAYSSKDMKYVEEVVKALEDEGISCFVAMRNLRHGKGSVENYDYALSKAIDNSRVFLLVSTPNSRSRSCDAFTKEIPYVKKKDIEYAPAEYKHDYLKMPARFKKPRIQLVVGEKPGNTIADKIVNEFFNGIEWCYSYEQVAERIYKILDEQANEAIETPKVIEKPDNVEVKQEPANSELDRMKQELEALRREKEEAEAKRQAEEEALRVKQELEALRKEKEEAEVKQKAEEEIIRKEKEEASKLYKRDGNDIYFGSYFQSSTKKKEPLKWNILKEENGKVLVITDKIIESGAFDNESNDYEDSSLREWLNNEFYNTAFDEKEKSIIDVTLVDNSLESTMYEENQYVCNNTNDKIFLLSNLEAYTYYQNDDERRASETKYVKKKSIGSSHDSMYWWLRSPCFNSSNGTCIIGYYGDIDCLYVGSIECGVRPALWLDLSKNEKKESETKIKSKEEPKKHEESSNPYIRDGNSVYLGSYYQSNKNTKEPIKWNILSEENGYALLISEKIIDEIKFDDKKNNYEKSYIRQWLNSDFYNNAFNEKEKGIIVPAYVDNDLNSTGVDENSYNAKNKYLCNDTNDIIFPLSVREAETFFKSNSKRKASPTKYAKEKGGDGQWWLRSPSRYEAHHMCGVSYDGTCYGVTLNVKVPHGIRPSLFIKI